MKPGVPPLAEWLLRRWRRSPDTTYLLGDLAEGFAKRAASDPRAARRWYWMQAVRSLKHRPPASDPSERFGLARTSASSGSVLLEDLRFSVRSFTRQPGISLLAASVLGLGLGLNAAIFAVLSALLFQPPPVRDPAHLVYIYRILHLRSGERTSTVSTDELRRLALQPALAGLSGTWGVTMRFSADDQGRVEHGEVVEPGYFEVLGITTVLGRPLVPADHDADAATAVVISEALWRNRFESRADILGTKVQLGDERDATFTIVGVAQSGFTGISAPWIPTSFWIAATPAERAVIKPPRGVHLSFIGIARLGAGVSLSEARALVEAQPREASGAAADEVRLRLLPSSDVRVPDNPTAEVIPGRLAAALMAVGVMVLLVAATNITGIVMARNVSRSPEIALRRALGAGGVRIIRQLFIDGLLLAAAGGVAGMGLAELMLRLFERLEPAATFALHPSIGWRTALFATTASLVCGLLIGLGPARQCLRASVLLTLGSRRSVSSRADSRLQWTILSPQLALSLALLLAAGTYLRAYAKLELNDRGYDPAGVVVVNTAMRSVESVPQAETADARAERARSYYQRLVDGLRALPGVRGGLIMLWLPLEVPAERGLSHVVPVGAAADLASVAVEGSEISPGYFDAMGMRILRGRDLDARDTLNSPRVGILSASVAAHLWPGSDPIGRTASIQGQVKSAAPIVFEVIGVVNDIRAVLQETGQVPHAYLSLGQRMNPSALVVVARGAEPGATMRQVTSAVAEAEPLAEALAPQTMEQMIDAVLYPRRVAAVVLVAAGAVVLLLAGVGLFGVASYSVAQRRGEIGMRRALGADRRDIHTLIIGQALRVAVVGASAGMVLGYLAIRFASSKFESMPPLDALTALAAPLILIAVIILACNVPARKAAAMEPLDVLRQ